jgi:hypothetical protein
MQGMAFDRSNVLLAMARKDWGSGLGEQFLNAKYWPDKVRND